MTSYGNTLRVTENPRGSGPPVIVGSVEILTTGTKQESGQKAPTKTLENGSEITQRNTVKPESGTITGWTETEGLAELRELSDQDEPIPVSVSEGTIPNCLVENVSRSNGDHGLGIHKVTIEWRQILVANIGTATIQAVTADGTSTPSAQDTAEGAEETILGSESETTSSGPSVDPLGGEDTVGGGSVGLPTQSLEAATADVTAQSTLADDDLPGTTTVSDLTLHSDDPTRVQPSKTPTTSDDSLGQLTPQVTASATTTTTAAERRTESPASQFLDAILNSIANWRASSGSSAGGTSGLRISEFDGVRLPTKLIRDRQPVALTLRDHPAWPSDTLRIYMNWNNASEQWVWEVELDGHGSVIGPVPVGYGRGYQFGGYFGFSFVDLSRGTEMVTPSNLGGSVSLVGIPGPLSEGYRDWVVRQAQRDPDVSEETVAAFLGLG